MSKGDKAVIIVDTGNGTSREFVMEATKNGRAIEISTAKGLTEVTEIKHTGVVVRTSTFMTSRVIALMEEPVEVDEAEPAATEPSLFDGEL